MTTTQSEITDERLREMLAGLEGVTPGPWDNTVNLVRAIDGDLAIPIFEGRDPWKKHRRTSTVLRQAWHNLDHVSRCDPDTMRQVLTLALKALTRRSSAGVVKGLEWEMGEAACGYGVYSIHNITPLAWSVRLNGTVVPGGGRLPHEQAALEFAQGHFNAAILSALSPQEPVTGEAVHPDDAAVDRFASAMKAKLAKKRSEGRGGWENKEECSAAFLSSLLHGHVLKGDPVDVANLAMMLHQRGESILPTPNSAEHVNGAFEFRSRHPSPSPLPAAEGEAIGAMQKEALRLLQAYDERQDQVQAIIEELREIVLLMPAAARPEGLMKHAQNAVYAMRGRLRLMDDAAITGALAAPSTGENDAMVERALDALAALDKELADHGYAPIGTLRATLDTASTALLAAHGEK